MGSVPLVVKGLVLLLVLNFKNFPLVWHARFARTLITRTVRYYLLKPSARRPHIRPHAPEAVFTPLKYVSRVTVGDIDFNLHKSNSTYSSDLDMARTSFVLTKLDHFMILNFKYYVAVGAVSFQFHKQIDMFEKFHIETSILAWDRKWLYLQSRFIGSDGAVRTTALTKYVFKLGRKTTPPAEILAACGYDVDNDTVEARRAEGLSQALAFSSESPVTSTSATPVTSGRD